MISRQVGKDERNIGLDILRIISMMMIITLHILSHGGLSDAVQFGSKEYFITNSFRALSDIGVNCFILISSYFLCEMVFSIKRIIRVEIQVLFYSIIGMLIYCFIFGMDIKRIVQSVTPFLSGEYWFITYYIILLLLSPFLNILIRDLTKQQYKKLLLIVILVFSVIPNVFPWSKSFFSRGNDLLWFVTLYFIGAYVKLYTIKIKPRIIWAFVPCFITVVLEFVIIKLCVILGYGDQHRFLYFNNNPLFLIASISAFQLFLNIRIKNVLCVRFISVLASCSFGVYLIHDNPNIRQILWKEIDPTKFCNYNPLLMVLSIIGTIIGIYLACSIIDLLRQLIFKAIRMDALYEKVQNKFNAIVVDVVSKK